MKKPFFSEVRETAFLIILIFEFELCNSSSDVNLTDLSVFKCSRALFEECTHAFLLIFRSEASAECFGFQCRA